MVVSVGKSYSRWKNAEVGQYLDQENIQGVYKLHTIFLIGMRHVTILIERRQYT